MLLIQYTFSTNAFSSEETTRFVVPLLKVLLHNPTREQLLFWHHVIRKAAHVTEYCILGLLVYRAFKVDIAKKSKVRMLTHVCRGRATLDEFHCPSFPEGSSVSMSDGIASVASSPSCCCGYGELTGLLKNEAGNLYSHSIL
jgi:VanZ family protein